MKTGNEDKQPIAYLLLRYFDFNVAPANVTCIALVFAYEKSQLRIADRVIGRLAEILGNGMVRTESGDFRPVRHAYSGGCRQACSSPRSRKFLD